MPPKTASKTFITVKSNLGEDAGALLSDAAPLVPEEISATVAALANFWTTNAAGECFSVMRGKETAHGVPS